VIGYGLWQRNFGSDPHIVGRTITLNEHDFTVIGVAPADCARVSKGAAGSQTSSQGDEQQRKNWLSEARAQNLRARVRAQRDRTS
jgi:hypothetical protein